MSVDVLRGRVWKLDHDISTDVLSPGQYAVDPVEIRKLHVLESVIPDFVSEVREGDVIVAGRNFGCGSSRETAAENLAALGIACVVAESLSRLFMRNAVAVGLPVVVAHGAHQGFADGDDVEIDLRSGRVANLSGNKIIQGESLPEEMRDILAAGGILAVLRTQA
jgi:3-isopropylmalate/(R)-2-methylmalate dehydratase small subunit